MPEFPFELEDREVQARLESRIDPEGKISRALAELGQLEGRRALLPDVGEGLRAGQLRAAGAIVVAPEATQAAPPERYVSFWGGLHPDASDPDGLLERIRGSLAPDGRILLVHDYGRDDASRLLGDRAREERRIAWSNRKGWFLERGFRLRVVHCWWAFDSLEQASELLAAAFGGAGAGLAARLRRPRLTHKVAVYHLALG